jgi:RecQ-mediated genome instability protein 1
VEACVEWIEQEEGSSILPVSSVREMVYEQWLHANLREVVSRPCIPTSVTDQQATQICGRFIVQVDSVIDVGAAAYAQLQKIKGHSLDNVENSGNIRNFEPKPTRLLLMSLTDGVTDVQAMEYQPIPQLNTELVPGTKLLLQGTINCRLGTLLVSGSHVQVLGGGVESLIDVNQQKRVLARALNNESLAGEGGDSGGPNINDEVEATTEPTNQAAATPGATLHLQGDNEQNQVEGMQIADLDLENFDDFEDMSNELQDAQEQWPEEIDFSPQDLPEEETEATILGDRKEISSASSTDTTVSHQPQQSTSRTVGQKWRPASVPEDSGKFVLPDASISLPGPSGLSTGKRTKVSQHAECEPPQHLGMEASGSASQRTTVTASVRPMAVEGNLRHSERDPIPPSGVPVLMTLPQTAHVWAANPLVRVKAHFVRVTGKLKPCDGKWSVAVVIEDDSGGQLNVQLSNQVLEKLIGFTAQEFVEYIQPNKSDPVIKARGSKGFKHCQSYLATLDCLMEIRKQSTFGDHPIVERLLDTE